MKVYVDTSVYNRPFDDQSQPRIWLEALALVIVLQMIKDGAVELVSSSVLEYENSRNPFDIRKEWVNRCLSLANDAQGVDENIRARALELEKDGLGGIDALHLACAGAAGSRYFLTCDDRVIRRYQGGVQALNPVDFILTTAGGQP